MPITGLKLTYDLELVWARMSSSSQRDAQISFWIDGSLVGTSTKLDNHDFGSDDAVRWLCDGELDALDARRVRETRNISGLSIPDGATFTLGFGYATHSAGRNLNLGIDNLVIETAH